MGKKRLIFVVRGLIAAVLLFEFSKFILAADDTAMQSYKYPCVPLGRVEGKVKEDGLAGYWKFDEGEGKIVRDSSGNGNDGVAHKTKWLNTMHGSALEFNGEDSYVEIRYPKESIQPKSAMTLMGWFYFEDDPARKTGLIWACDYSYMLHVEHVIQFNFRSEKEGVKNAINFDLRCLKIPGWNHITATYNGKELKMYLNGELKSEVPSGGNIRYSEGFKLAFGRRSDYKHLKDGLTGHFKGRMDEVKVYDRALKGGKIEAEFKKGEKAFLVHRGEQMAMSFRKD